MNQQLYEKHEYSFNRYYDATIPLPKAPHSPAASWTASSTTTSEPVRRASSRIVASMIYSPPSIGQKRAKVGSMGGLDGDAYMERCCVLGWRMMWRLCKASSSISGGGKAEVVVDSWSEVVSSGVQRISRPTGNGSTSLIAVETLLRLLGFSGSSTCAGSSCISCVKAWMLG